MTVTSLMPAAGYQLLNFNLQMANAGLAQKVGVIPPFPFGKLRERLLERLGAFGNTATPAALGFRRYRLTVRAAGLEDLIGMLLQEARDR